MKETKNLIKIISMMPKKYIQMHTSIFKKVTKLFKKMKRF